MCARERIHAERRDLAAFRRVERDHALTDQQPVRRAGDLHARDATSFVRHRVATRQHRPPGDGLATRTFDGRRHEREHGRNGKHAS